MDNTNTLFEAIANATKLDIPINDLTKIVVIGDQSSGKSSLIEALCGSGFLPKKEGMSTRKPINITLINSDTYKFFVENNEYDNEIDALNEINTLNESKSIIHNKVTNINVKVLSQNVYNMSFIDTPGLIVLEDDGVKPQDIKDLIITYLQDPNNIFLLVCSAATDPATSQAFGLIREYNREKDTMGVLTKMDLNGCIENNNILDILAGKKFQLGYKWGCVKLRNKSQIYQNVSIRESLHIEQEYFSSCELPTNLKSVPNILYNLSNIQINKIISNIPLIISNIDEKILNLRNSKTFLEQIMCDSNELLADKLVKIFEKLTDSSLERAEFDMKLKNNIKDGLIQYMNKIYGYDKELKITIPKSNQIIESYVFDYHHNNCTKIQNLRENKFHDIFSNNNLYQSSLSENIKKAFRNEIDLSMMFNVFEFNFNVEVTKKLDWKSYVSKYFNSLHSDNKLQDIVYTITENMIIEYITTSSIEDEVTVKFSEYLVKEIGKKSYAADIKYSINNLIKIEEEPNINMFELIRELLTVIDPQEIEMYKGWLGKYNNYKIKIDLYGELFNIAYLRSVINSVAFNCYRIVIVNLIKKMAFELLNIVLSLNKESALKENTEIINKIDALYNLKNTLISFQQI